MSSRRVEDAIRSRGIVANRIGADRVLARALIVAAARDAHRILDRQMIRRIDFDLESPTGWMFTYRRLGAVAELHFARTGLDATAYGTVAHVAVEARLSCRTLTVAVYTLLPEGLYDRTDYIQERDRREWWINAACRVADGLPGASALELRTHTLGQCLARHYLGKMY